MKVENYQLTDAEKFILEESDKKFKEWFYVRGLTEADLMYADAAFKKYQRAEETMPDKRPFDKAPGFRRMFMMGYLYGKRN